MKTLKNQEKHLRSQLLKTVQLFSYTKKLKNYIKYSQPLQSAKFSYTKYSRRTIQNTQNDTHLGVK